MWLFSVSASNRVPACVVNTWGREFSFRSIVSNRDTEQNDDRERERERLRYLSWKKKTYMDPTQAMTQISQRMWHDQGPSSLSINLRKQISTSECAKQLRSPPNCISSIDGPTRESRRQLWRSRWPFCHTCGNAAPPSCTVTKRRNIGAHFIV